VAFLIREKRFSLSSQNPCYKIDNIVMIRRLNRMRIGGDIKKNVSKSRGMD
jgi:hypothetical protein